MAAMLADTDGTDQRQTAFTQRVSWRWVLLVFLVAVTARCGNLTRPLLGNFATKNAAYGMIARNFARGEAPPWQPRVDVIVNGERGAHLLEVPLTAYVAGLGWRLLGGSLDVWGRCVSVFASALTAALLTILGGRWFGKVAGVAAGLAYALSPVSVIFGQSFMLEASVALFAIAAILCVDVWRERNGWPWLVVAGVALAALFLTKIYMLVICWPIVWLAIRNGKVAKQRKQPEDEASRLRRLLAVGVMILLASAPAIAWLIYVNQASAADADNSHIFYSLRDSASAHAWPPPVLRSPEFYQQFLDDLAGIVLTPIGLALALCGFANRRWFALIPWFGCSAVLVLVLPLKFHEMNYYFVPILPPMCLLIGLGWQNLVSSKCFSRPGWQVLIFAVAVIFAARYAARPAFVTPAEDHSVLAAAEAAREASEEHDRVITVHGTSIDLLYYCDRAGWALSANDPELALRIAELARADAQVLVIANLDALPTSTQRQLESSYVLRVRDDGFVVLQMSGD